MSMQINVDPAGLTQEQREAVAGFILAYPGKACAGSCGKHTLGLEVHVDTTKAVAAVDALAAHANAAGLPAAVAGAVDVELATLQHDQESTLPEAAFGSHGSAALDADAAKLNAIFGQGVAGPTLADVGLAPAAAFGVPPAPLAGSIPAIAAASTVAPPPPANTAPTTTTPGAASSAAGVSSAGVELDKHGLPWDGRIHAESKGKLTDGSWRKKRQVDPALVAQVEAELRQVMGAAPAAPLAQGVAPAPTPVSVAASTIAQSVPTGAVPLPVAPSVPPAPVAGAAPTMPAAPNVAPAGEVPQDARQQFVGLVGRASAAIQAGKVSQAEVNQICADSGIPALPLLANRLDLVATVASRIDALIAARGQ